MVGLNLDKHKILLIHPPSNLPDVIGKVSNFIFPAPPLGLLYIAAVLEKKGFKVEVLDAFLFNLDFQEIIRIIQEKKPMFVGIPCLTSSAPIVLKLTKYIRATFPDIKIVLGNVHASVFAEDFLRGDYADFIVHGEGEYSMLELAQAVSCGGSLEHIRGISWLNDSKVIHNPPRNYIQDLDMLPFPARHLVPMEKYKGVAHSRFRSNMILILTSRGCPNSCIFCAQHQTQGRQYRYRSAKNIVEEIEIVIKKYKAKNIFFSDILFGANKNHVFELCEEIIKKKIDINWLCEGHINFINRKILKKMKEAGCTFIGYGIESGSQGLLNEIKKGTSLERIEEVIRYTKECGIKTVIGFFMLGLPGDTKKTIVETVNFARRLPLDIVQFNLTVPFPGSDLYDNLIKKNLLSDKWERYSFYTTFTKEEPIFVPDGMNSDELKKLHKWALRSVYLRPKGIFAFLCLRFKNIKELFKLVLEFF